MSQYIETCGETCVKNILGRYCHRHSVRRAESKYIETTLQNVSRRPMSKYMLTTLHKYAWEAMSQYIWEAMSQYIWEAMPQYIEPTLGKLVGRPVSEYIGKTLRWSNSFSQGKKMRPDHPISSTGSTFKKSDFCKSPSFLFWFWTLS